MGSHPSHVMFALRRIVRFLRLADRQAEQAVGLSAAQLYVLGELAVSPANSLGELAERTLTDQSSVSTVVAKLVARKLVARKPAPGDRRRVELRLTAAGEKLVRTAPVVPQTRIAHVVRTMPAARRDHLVRSLEALATAIGAGSLAPTMLFEEDEPRRRNRARSRT